MRQFYVSFITSSFLCLSIASASSVIEEVQTAVTSSTSISATTSQATPKDELTSFTDRLKVVREYYGENPNNPDLGILSHLVRWHDQDVKAIRARLTSPAHQSKLDEYRVVAARAAANQKLNFESLGALYLLYSQLQSDDLEPRAEETYEPSEVASLLHFVEHGTHDTFLTAYFEERQKPGSEWAAFAKDTFYFDDLEGFRYLYARGLRPLPIVSEDGTATFREINESFGLETPLLGDPLERANYDGNLEALQRTFYFHDMNHARQTLNYALYRKLNQIICEIKDPKRQFLCDFILFDLGHEQNFFGAQPDENLTQETLESLVVQLVKGNLRSLTNFCTAQTLDKTDPIILCFNLMVNPSSQQTESLETILVSKNLPKDVPVKFRDLFQGEGFQENIEDYQSFTSEAFFHNWVFRALTSYNNLLELESYFQKNGLPEFKMWKNDKIDLQSIQEQLKMAAQVFLEEVRSKF